MSQYTQTDAQKQFLRQRAINKRRDLRSCDCPGCNTCTGNKAGCVMKNLSQISWPG